MLRIYNSLSGEKEAIPPSEEQKKIRMFVCGPTVYDYLHIGNARTYVFFDFFAKYLRSQGYEVNYLQNITDIDDKIINRAAEENKKPSVLATSFTEAYLEDMKSLGIDAVTEYAPATKFVMQIAAQVERLIDKGFAYKIEGDGWYFDISKDEDYGKLSHRTVEQAEDSMSRIDEAVGKRNKGDFCLWKFSKAGEPLWVTSLGEGRPGWHIEDTAISEFYFGPQYEIHGGGVDLKFPHHEAEIAQQESASGLIPFVKTWMHVGALLVDGKKMSKSLGNFITIRGFLEKYPPEVLRWITLTHHYRSPIDFSAQSAEAAKAGLENLYTRCLEVRDEAGKEEKQLSHADGLAWKAEFDEAMNDDVNAPKAISVFFEMLKDDTLPAKAKHGLIDAFDQMLGLHILEVIARTDSIPAKITQKFNQYRQLREDKQFAESDALRKEIESLGYSIKDSKDGSEIAKKFF